MFMVMINQNKCIGCASCIDACPAKLLSMVDEKAEVSGDAAECLGCETCVELCPNDCFNIMEL